MNLFYSPSCLVGDPALAEEQVDEFGGVHPGVLVGVGEQRRHRRHRDHLHHRVLPQARVLPGKSEESGRAFVNEYTWAWAGI